MSAISQEVLYEIDNPRTKPACARSIPIYREAALTGFIQGGYTGDTANYPTTELGHNAPDKTTAGSVHQGHPAVQGGVS